jgi:hypothetical protein
MSEKERKKFWVEFQAFTRAIAVHFSGQIGSIAAALSSDRLMHVRLYSRTDEGE